MAPILEVRQVTKRFGGLLALSGVDMAIERGHVHALIGPNGAGKTTLTNVVSGMSHASDGQVAFKGEDITQKRADQISAMGVSRTFQNLRCFPTMTALENVMVGRHLRNRTSAWATLLRLPLTEPSEERRARERAEELLATVGLVGRNDSLAARLSLMEQRRIEIARALACEPELLLLDEPTAGMGAGESSQVQELVRELAGKGITILIIAHDMHLVMNVADRITVLNFGVKIADGLPAEVRANRQVEEAYLGTDE